MAEWLKAHAWKACVRETVPWVRIPLSPPAAQKIPVIVLRGGGTLRKSRCLLRNIHFRNPEPIQPPSMAVARPATRIIPGLRADAPAMVPEVGDGDRLTGMLGRPLRSYRDFAAEIAASA